MSEYPKLMLVRKFIHEEYKLRLVMFEKDSLYYAVNEYDKSLDEFIKNRCFIDFTLIAWPYSKDISKKEKRPMNIYEFQKFCNDANCLMKRKREKHWYTARNFGFSEENCISEINLYHYKLNDGTIGEFEVEK